MILIIIIVIGLTVQVLHLSQRIGVHLTRKQLGGIETIVIGLHHFRQTGNEFIAAINGHIDLSGHRLVALGLDDQYATGTLGSIEGSTVFQHLDTLNVVDVKVSQDVVGVTVVQHLAVVLHIHEHTVDDDQRLGIAPERVDTLDEHGVTHTGNTATAHCANIGTKTLGNKGINAQLGIIVKMTGLTAHRSDGLTAIGLAEGIAVELAVGLAIADGTLLQVVTIDAHYDRTGVCGYFQLIISLFVGH